MSKFTFQVQYYNRNRNVQSVPVEIQGLTRECARMELEHSFRSMFHGCEKIHIE